MEGFVETFHSYLVASFALAFVASINHIALASALELEQTIAVASSLETLVARTEEQQKLEAICFRKA